MPAYPRAELEEMVERWLQANRDAEAAGDWRTMADLYAEDATYGWNYGPGEDFMCVGRDEIRDVALGVEMGGLDGWEYPYQRVLIDDQQGEVIGLWKQVATVPDGGTEEVAGIGGSWFGYAGNFQWAWQRDWFDVGNATALFIKMFRDGTLSDGMKRRLDYAASGEPQPCRYPIGEAPVGIWP